MEILEKVIECSQNLNLLYIEDDTDARESTSVIFEDFFKSVITAVDGEDGLFLFKKNKELNNTNSFDLIITDINMPKLNGLEMIERIRKIDKEIPILIVSAYNDSGNFIKSIKFGIDGYLMKPIDIDQFLVTLEKITEKLKIKDNLENQILLAKQYQEAIDFSAIVSKGDKDGKITYINDNFCRVSGYTKEEILGKNHNIIRHPDSKKAIFEDMWETIKNKKEKWSGIIKNKAKNGESYYVNTTIKPILNKYGEIIEYLSLRHDISSVMSDKQHFLDRINQNTLSILILIQIDEYEMLEKFYNPSLLDKLEKEFSYRLLSFLPNSYKFEHVYNLESGRYALVTDFYMFEKNKIVIKDYLSEFVANVRNSIIEIDSIEYSLNITSSYALGKHMLYEDAKAGLEEAINNNIMLCHSNDFSIKFQEEAKNNIKTIKMLKTALDNYNVVSFFQPIINNRTKEIEKYESLVRIIDQDNNILTPYHFLSISKKGNYYNKITLRVLENSFNMLSKVKNDLSINLSTLDIEKDETREKIFELLNLYKNERNRLVFELLEDENAKDFKTIKRFVKEVKELGVSIAIDDFGAGYSNFERLLEFDPDILKIDGSLIKNIETDQYSLSVVKTIVSFAKEQNIKTVAEFVENENIFNILKDIGIDYSQGYYFGKPAPLR